MHWGRLSKTDQKRATNHTRHVPHFGIFDVNVCFVEYRDDNESFQTLTQQGFEPKAVKRPWSAEEKQKLLRGFRQIRDGSLHVHLDDNWAFLSRHVMDGTRTPEECAKQLDALLQAGSQITLT